MFENEKNLVMNTVTYAFAPTHLATNYCKEMETLRKLSSKAQFQYVSLYIFGQRKLLWWKWSSDIRKYLGKWYLDSNSTHNSENCFKTF